MSTLLACRAAQGIRIHKVRERPYLLVSPAEHESNLSLFTSPRSWTRAATRWSRVDSVNAGWAPSLPC